MLPNGYGQIAVLEKDLCLAVAGFWINTRIYCGKYIDIDNVVVREGYRSRGIGKLVTDWLEELGRNEGCGYSILDAYVENSKAHKFYFREGYMIRGFHFLKKLKDQV
jgi:GNAT superfamily N-acetyltransferase